MTDVRTDPWNEVFERRLVANAHTLVDLRRQFARWLDGLGLPAQRRDDVVLAVYEAMANSAEHAYRDSADGGLTEIHAGARGHQLTVRVTDYGRWKAPNPGDTIRGRGLVLISALADRNTLAPRGDGTTVTMTWNELPPPG